MTNVDRLQLIHAMLIEYYTEPSDYRGLCSLCRITAIKQYGEVHSLKEAFPAIKFFARVYGGRHILGSLYYWWATGDFTQRLKLLHALKRWYMFKLRLKLKS